LDFDLAGIKCTERDSQSPALLRLIFRAKFNQEYRSF
jgi:hypothetical protein